MTIQEFSQQFDVLYNNITSNQAPGLTEYEKSVFLTKAQNEILLSYFDARLNKSQVGFDGNTKRQIDFSNVMKTLEFSKLGKSFAPAKLDTHYNSVSVNIPDGKNIMFIINEMLMIGDTVEEDTSKYPAIEDMDTPKTSWVEFEGEDDTYDPSSPDNRDKSEVYYNPDTNEFYAVLEVEEFGTITTYYTYTLTTDYYSKWGTVTYHTVPKVGLIYRTGNSFVKYIKEGFTDYNTVKYTKHLMVNPISAQEYYQLMLKPFTRPLKNQAWRLAVESEGTGKTFDLIPGPNDTISEYKIRYVKRPNPIILEGAMESGLSIEGYESPTECELDPILHPEILQRAIEDAKAAWAGDLNSTIALGANSNTNIGVVGSASPQERSR